MRVLSNLTACLTGLLLATVATAAPNITSGTQRSSFTPPKVFLNTNLVRNIDLTKSYARDTVNVVVENVASAPQGVYYFPANAEGIMGGFEARDKKNPDAAPLKTELKEAWYKVTLPTPLKFKEQITLSLTYSLLDTYQPLPAKIEQTDQQYLAHSFSAILPSAYETTKQKTKIKFPSAAIEDYTVLRGKYSSENAEDPVKAGTALTYGPFGKVVSGIYMEPVQVRFESTKPVSYVSKLERDIEVSHWGGNIATEERYWYENRGASLKSNFDRVKWAATAYYAPVTSALKEFTIPLRKGASNPYFVDDVGNVSTSHFRQGATPLLELKPRYPIFGDWKYKFKIGYDNDLDSFVRKTKSGSDSYILKVPFLEGPKQAEGVAYEHVTVRVILPEGANNIKFDTDGIDIISSFQSTHRTYMDTVGRTALTLEAVNVVDELRGRDILITYDYPFFAAFRKPVTILVGIFTVFVTAWGVSLIDVNISKKKRTA